jgi:hypothetical protein
MTPGPKGCDCGECVTCLWRECEETAADALRLTRELATARDTIAPLEAALLTAQTALATIKRRGCAFVGVLGPRVMTCLDRGAANRCIQCEAGLAFARVAELLATASTPPTGTPPTPETAK